MKYYCLIYQYDNKKFMNVDKLIEFKQNLEILEKSNIIVKLMFFGETSNEELASFMGYFNRLVCRKVCNISISLKTKELVEENGINNKIIENSALESINIKNEQVMNIIKNYYNKDIEIKALSSENWENNILDLIGE